MGEGPDGAGELAERDELAGARQAVDVAQGLGVPTGQLGPEGDGLPMDAVGAAGHPSPPVLARQRLDPVGGGAPILDQEVRGLLNCRARAVSNTSEEVNP